MSEITFADSGGLIQVRIQPRTETYYLVTQDNLTSIMEKNILTDVFTLVASLLWGAFFSVLISLGASQNLEDTTKQALEVYKTVFLWLGVVFSSLAVFFLIMTNMRIQSLKKFKLTAKCESESSKPDAGGGSSRRS